MSQLLYKVVLLVGFLGFLVLFFSQNLLTMSGLPMSEVSDFLVSASSLLSGLVKFTDIFLVAGTGIAAVQLSLLIVFVYANYRFLMLFINILR